MPSSRMKIYVGAPVLGKLQQPTQRVFLPRIGLFVSGLYQGNFHTKNVLEALVCLVLLAVTQTDLIEYIDVKVIQSFYQKVGLWVAFTQPISCNSLEFKYICKFSVLVLIIFCPVVLHASAVICSRRSDSHRQNSRLPTVCTQR